MRTVFMFCSTMSCHVSFPLINTSVASIRVIPFTIVKMERGSIDDDTVEIRKLDNKLHNELHIL